jgi:putative transposase
MRLTDELHTAHPELGTRKMVIFLEREGEKVGRKKMRTIFQLLGIEAIYPKPNLSIPHPEHKIYPYLLRDVSIDRRDQVWSTDITYIRLKTGFVYLMAIIDWYSRYVLDWEVSTSLEADFCVETLARCFGKGICEIFNTDQGSQFTSIAFTDLVLKNNIKLSMDGRGRALDNIFVERLWRSVKYECIYPRDYENVLEVKKGLAKYFEYYNNIRPHQSLKYLTPSEVYEGKKMNF